MGISLTKKELATIAGYTYRRLYDIDRDLPVGKKLFVKGEGDKYDLAIFVQKWVQYNSESIEYSEAPDLIAIKAKHEAIKAEKTQIEVDRLRGELVSVQDVRKLWGDIANTVLQNMLHLPDKVAPMLPMIEDEKAIANILREEIRRTLSSIADTPLPDYAAAEKGEDGEEDNEGEV